SAEYIVVFKSNVSKEDIDKYADGVNENGGEVSQRYDSKLKGFAATIPDQYLLSLQSLQGDVIDYIEPDGVVTTQ
ncbi:protease propeptide/inhibitor, partial [Ramaria rubella]